MRGAPDYSVLRRATVRLEYRLELRLTERRRRMREGFARPIRAKLQIAWSAVLLEKLLRSFGRDAMDISMTGVAAWAKRLHKDRIRIAGLLQAIKFKTP